MYRADRVKNIITYIKKKKIKKNLGWCDDPTSSLYNKLVFLPFKKNHERLYLKKNIYDLILVLNFNIRPIKKGHGSAIFLHISDRNFKATKGCIAIKRKDFLKILKKITNKTNLIIN